MAEVLVLVLSKIVSPLAEEAVSQLSKEVSSLKELPAKVNYIKGELNMMKAVIQSRGADHLCDVEHSEWSGWIANVRILAYKVEDVMDKYLYHALRRASEGYVKKAAKKVHYAGVFREIAQEMDGTKDLIIDIISLRDQWLIPGKAPPPPSQPGPVQFQDCSPEFVKDKYLVGMDVTRKTLSEWFNSDEDTYMLITVSGMGGLGKSNLVWNMYEGEKAQFGAHAWIDLWPTYHSPDPDALLRTLLKEIAKAPLPDDIDKLLPHDLKVELEDRVKGKKCLIVLDGARDNKAYSTVHDAFLTVHKASRIIMTTRSHDEPRLSTADAPLSRWLELQPLDGKDAKQLFCSKSSLNIQSCSQEFRDHAENVIQKCGNHPAAIISIAKQLSAESQTVTHWRHTCNQLRSELAKDNLVQRILRRSYNHLPEDLRNCFLFCSLFRAGCPISRQILVRLLVAEGFVVKKELNTPEMVAEGNIRNLIHLNLLQPVEINEFGEVVTCRMHPVLRILALSVCEAVTFGVAKDHGTMQQMDDEVRRLSAFGPRHSNSSDPQKGKKKSSDIKCPHLRTLITDGTIGVVPHNLSWISSELKYLTVLLLEDSSLAEVPESIGELFNLCYLGLRGTKVKVLPRSIKYLLNLQTLDLKSTGIEKLPKGIKKLTRLRHLLADRCTEETSPEFQYFKGVAAPNDLSSFQELQTLETVQSNMELGKQLEEVEQLSSVCIDNVEAAHCKDLLASLLKMPRLSSLLLSVRDMNETLAIQAMEPTSSKIEKLRIRGGLAEGMLRSLFPHHGNKIKHLELTSCQFEGDPLQLLAEHLPELNHLSLNNVSSSTTHDFVLPAGKFRLLKTLLLKNMHGVHLLTIQGGAVPTIEALHIASMPNLVNVPSGFQSLKSLKKVSLRGMAQAFVDKWKKEQWRQKLQHILDLSVEGVE